jgi:hypothetical protein
MQVENLLTGKSFCIDRNINAKAMDAHGAKVAKTLMDAQKKKKKMTIRLRPISKNVTLAVMTRAYMEDVGSKKKGKKGKKAESADRDPDVWADFAQFEQQADEPVKPPPSKKPVNPTSGAPSTSGAAAVVESTPQVSADHELIRGVMGPNVDPEKVIDRCREGAAHWAAMLNARNAQN